MANQRELRGQSTESLGDAIKKAVHTRGPGPVKDYRVAEIVVQTSHRSPGIVDVYRVRLEEV